MNHIVFSIYFITMAHDYNSLLKIQRLPRTLILVMIISFGNLLWLTVLGLHSVVSLFDIII